MLDHVSASRKPTSRPTRIVRFAEALARGAVDDAEALDERIGDAARTGASSGWPRSIGWCCGMAVHELLALRDTPPRVVINEAIELARAFSGEDAAKFVNGVLDGAFRTLKDEGNVVE